MTGSSIDRAGTSLLDAVFAECRSSDGRLHEAAALKVLRDAAKAGDGVAAEEAARGLVARDPALQRLGAFLGDLTFEDGRKQEAEGFYERALPEGEGGDPAVLRALAYTLDDLGRPAERIDRAYRAAIAANPHDRSLLGRWMGLLDREGRDRRAAFAELQAANEDLIGSIVTVLVERGVAIETLEPVFQARIARFRESEAFAAIDAVWAAFCGLKQLRWQAWERAMPHFGPAATLAFLLRKPRIRRFGLHLGSSAKEAKSGHRLNLPAVRTYFNETFLGLDGNAWLAFLESRAAFPNETARHTVIARDRFCLWQDRTVAQRTVRFLHPIDRVEVEPIDTFIFSGRTVYTFPGRTPFLLITGGGGSKALAAYLPAMNVLIDFGGGIGSAISDYALASLFGVMARRLCDHIKPYNAAVKAKSAGSGPRRVCLAVGTAQNFAHHLWNYYPALERLIRAGLAGHVDEVYAAGSQFFGPVEALFPEFDRARFIAYPRGVLDPYPFSSEHLLLQPGGYFIPATLRERLARAMQARPPSDPAQAAPHFSGERRFPIVWIGLRLGDKSWADQEVAAASFIDRIGQAHPQALFLLDGFSYPVGSDDSSSAWETTIAALKAVAGSIVRRCRHPERVVDMIGNTLRESVLWAREADLYVTPHGTSQHKVGWLTSAPGIIYATPALESVPRERRPGSWEAEGVALPHYLFGEPVASGTRRSVNDRRGKIDNVTLDGEALAALALDLIAERAAAKD